VGLEAPSPEPQVSSLPHSLSARIGSLAAGATRRENGRRHRRQRQDSGGARKDPLRRRRDAEQERRRHLGRTECGWEACDESGGDDDERVAQDERTHVRGSGAERHPHAELTPPRGGASGSEAVEADRGQQQARTAEAHGQRGAKTFLSDRPCDRRLPCRRRSHDQLRRHVGERLNLEMW
jgi:hypothetical protein